MTVPSGRMRQNWCSLSWSIEVGTLIPEQCAKCGAAILVYIADIFTSLQFIGLPTWFLLHDEWISASHWYGSWNRLFYCVWICWTMLGGLTTAHLESYFNEESQRNSDSWGDFQRKSCRKLSECFISEHSSFTRSSNLGQGMSEHFKRSSWQGKPWAWRKKISDSRCCCLHRFATCRPADGVAHTSLNPRNHEE